jgi:hypothetical protein
MTYEFKDQSGFQEYFGKSHQLVRRSVKDFVTKEIMPFIEEWEEAGEQDLMSAIKNPNGHTASRETRSLSPGAIRTALKTSFIRFRPALKEPRPEARGSPFPSFPRYGSMMDPAVPSIVIINHLDVHQILLWMKANVDGMRSFLYYVGSCFDRMVTSADPETRGRYQGLMKS